jgi:hypothetical protein
MLRSNVYKTNRLSMAFHQKLGFKLTRENAKGVEFTAELAALKLPARKNKTCCSSAARFTALRGE